MIAQATEKTLMTIGYEGLDLSQFIKYLTCNHVKVLADVRELPSSRKRGFSKTALAENLAENGITYVHLRSLGSPRDVRHKLYADHNYEEFFSAYEKHLQNQDEGIEQLEQLVNDHGKVCVMCYEQDYTLCHRSSLAEHLCDQASETVKLQHIKTFT